MGVIQTYYYLAILSIGLITLTLVFAGVALSQLRRLFREGGEPLTAWLIAGAVVLVFLFLLLTTAGVLLGVATSGTA